MNVYVDLDETLIHADTDRRGRVLDIYVRPGASTFLYRIAQVGVPVLLTHAMREHADRALSLIGPAAEVFTEVISREDLQFVIDQLEAIESTPGLNDLDRRQLYREVLPIAPPGFMIDDQPVGSWIYLIKSRAIGIGPSQWIQVPGYEPARTGGSSLQAAYLELLKRAKREDALGGRRARA